MRIEREKKMGREKRWYEFIRDEQVWCGRFWGSLKTFSQLHLLIYIIDYGPYNSQSVTISNIVSLKGTQRTIWSIDICIGKLDDCLWTLFVICHDVKFLLHSFTSVDFIWVRNEANSAVYALAKFASQSQVSTFCNFDSLPPSVYKI